MRHPIKIEWVAGARKTGPVPLEFDYKATIWLGDNLWSCRLSNRIRKDDLVEFGKIDFLMEEAEKTYLEKYQDIPLSLTEGPKKVVARVTSCAETQH